MARRIAYGICFIRLPAEIVLMFPGLLATAWPNAGRASVQELVREVVFKCRLRAKLADSRGSSLWKDCRFIKGLRKESARGTLTVYYADRRDATGDRPTLTKVIQLAQELTGEASKEDEEAVRTSNDRLADTLDAIVQRISEFPINMGSHMASLYIYPFGNDTARKASA
ncbi:hypothetical protein BO83DRAFT_431673 [Aspergillus eucalypticola CBS 122712]|uniref:Uncharacterized protein n=1 Tax=Aspergillus eucalypticola (strain CBS 122712 / IBT 29274) TaxID=1448314 RepID=A0A317UPV6_ASPEC|nr:uncharacterized protein BO83DRAFT_431673 [Aspergillus eucalypticola CBS 122712]PWY63459.1 hypothetical protein BO83DRAFT_431673 [Aspergillus eucalypticola CBS 122712]